MTAPDLPQEAYAAALAGLPGMGPARLNVVLDHLSPLDAWACVRSSGWSGSVREALGSRADEVTREWHRAGAAVDVAAVWDRILDLGMGTWLRGTAGYPAVLAGDVEPPAIVFHQGSLLPAGGTRVAVVGTRRCSSTGAGIAFELGHDLSAAGVSVVSGLASGIDASAHRGALHAAAAPPVGVVATGLDVVYPRRQESLWHQVMEAGVMMAEAPPGTRPERWRFPARNRVIAALAEVVVVVESHERGGALYTVDEADRRAVDVMAVPGSVRSPASRGTNHLLAEGRAPVRDAGDVLVALGLSSARPEVPVDHRAPPASADLPVLRAVGWQPATLDQIVLRTGSPVHDLAPALCRLVEAGWLAQRGSSYEQVAQGWT